MGALLSYYWAPDPTNFTEAKELLPGLSKKDIAAVQKTWRILKQNNADSGKILFIELFKNHPEYQTLFKPFATVSIENLYGHGKFHAHAVTVMYALTSFIDNLADDDCLKELIYRAARNHFFRNVLPSNFADFTCLIIGALERKIGGILDHETFDAWQKAIKIINKRFEEGLDLAGQEENAQF